MKVIVGLGNPGPEFEKTYHNAGALALEAMAKRMGRGNAPLHFRQHKGLFEYGVSDGLALVRPLTFMNESGCGVREAMKKFKAAAKDLVVIHDESDLPLGAYRITFGRGAAGHKGVQSVVEALRTKDFTRVRIGIRKAGEKIRKKAESFVLKTISPSDEKILEEVFRNIAEEAA